MAALSTEASLRRIIAKMLVHIVAGEPIPYWTLQDAAALAGVTGNDGQIDAVRIARRALDGRDPSSADYDAARKRGMSYPFSVPIPGRER